MSADEDYLDTGRILNNLPGIQYLNAHQKELMEAMVNVDFSELEKRIISHMGIDISHDGDETVITQTLIDKDGTIHVRPIDPNEFYGSRPDMVIMDELGDLNLPPLVPLWEGDKLNRKQRRAQIARRRKK